LSLEKYYDNLTDIKEGLKIDYELKKIPSAINEIQEELEIIENIIENKIEIL
jgi:hypothetical protein